MKGKIIVGVLCLAVGFLAGMEYKAYQIRSAFGQAFGGSTESVSAAPKNVIDVEVGDVVELATLKYRLGDGKKTKNLPRAFGSPLTASAGASFIALPIEVTNTTDDEFPCPEIAVLVDDSGRRFSAVTDLGISEYILWEPLRPGIAKVGIIAFEVPDDVSVFYLQSAKAGSNDIFQTGFREE